MCWLVGLAALAAVQPAAAQQARPSLGILIGAYDRCMATYAVRLTKTAASDEAIFAQAMQSCLGLRDQVKAALRAELPPAQAAEIVATIDTRAKPDFLAMLAAIRRDRAARSAE